MIKQKQIVKYLVLISILFLRIFPVLYFCRDNKIGIEAVGDLDALLYLSGAREILATGNNQFNFFPPVNFLFIATFLYFTQGKIIGPMIAIATVGWFTVIGMYLLTKDLFGKKTAIIAAIIGGGYPDFIFYGSTFYPETLAIFFMTFSFMLLVKYFYNQRIVDIVLAGILWGLASLTRGGLHYFSIIISMFFFINYFKKGLKFSLKPTAVFFLLTYGTFFTLAGLIPENVGSTSVGSKSGIGSLIHGANRLIVCSTDYGNIPGNIFYDINNCGEEWPEESQLNMLELFNLNTSQMFFKVIEFVAKDSITYLKNSFTKLSNFWAPHTNPYLTWYIKVRFQQYNKIIAETVCSLISLIYVFIVCCGIWGISITKEAFRPLLLVFVITYCLMIFLTVGNSKLRLPLMPFFIIYCAYFLVQCKAGGWKKAFSNKWALIIILIFLANSVYKYPEILLSPAEIQVRKIEMCNQLGFPKTALCLLEKNKHYTFTTEQKKRLEVAEAVAKQHLSAIPEKKITIP